MRRTPSAPVRVRPLRWRATPARLLVVALLAATLQTVGAFSARASSSPRGTWASTREMQTGRHGHSATVLDGVACQAPPRPAWCGKVLVAGGQVPNPPGETGLRVVSSAELYDPATGRWETTASMATPRKSHLAAALGDGQVLVVDNSSSGGAEVYDAATNTWRSAARPRLRSSATLTALADGRALLVGGVAPLDAGEALPAPVAEAEIFVPDAGPAGAWTAAGRMQVPRSRHAATLLPDGRVLVAAGSAGVGAVATGGEVTEIYDPRTNGWSPAGATAVRRNGIPSLLPVAGNRALLFGGVTCQSRQSCLDAGASELLDVATRVWTTTGSMQNGHKAFVAAPLRDGRVLAVSDGVASEVFDAAASGTDAGGRTVPGGWAPAAATVVERATPTLVPLVDGRVLASGGYDVPRTGYLDSKTPMASAELFDPAGEIDSTPPSVVAVTPRFGPAGGGTSVVISGAAFRNVAAVRFGSTVAPYFRVESSTRIVATSPASDAGHVDVTVHTAGGVSTVVDAGRFAFGRTRGGWTTSAPLAAARTGHTATRLADGRVLVAGGTGRDGELLASVELFDPSKQSWSAAAPLGEARTAHRATLLPDGRVLVTGGRGPDAALSSVEMYDPALDSWAALAPLSRTRERHVAALLPDGLVLVAGGRGIGTQFAGTESAELYDPRGGGRTAPAQDMSAERVDAEATVLAGGTVLVSGGNASAYESEVYEPSDGSWVPTARVTQRRSRHSATVLPDGTVLAAGGINVSSVGGVVGEQASMIGTAERYDPASGKWNAIDRMGLARGDYGAATLAGGDVLAIGGCVEIDEAGEQCATRTSTVERYDFASRTWAAAAPLVAARTRHTSTLLADGRILTVGGEGDHGVLSSVEIYDADAAPAPGIAAVEPPGGTTSGGTAVTITGAGFFAAGVDVRFGDRPALSVHVRSDGDLVAVAPPHPPGTADVVIRTVNGPSLPARYSYAPGAWADTRALDACEGEACGSRYGHTATLLPDGRVLVAGGYTTQPDRKSASAVLYDPATARWSPAAPMTWARTGHRATLLGDGRVLVSGGADSAQAEVFEPPPVGSDGKGAWRVVGALAANRARHAAMLLRDGRVLVAGGRTPGSTELGTASVLSSAEVFTPSTGTWAAAGSLKEARYDSAAAVLPDGGVLIAGGCGSYGDRVQCRQALASVERFAPAAGAWSAAAAMPRPRSGATATPLAGGDILVAGGCSSFGFVLARASCLTFAHHALLFRNGAWEPAGSLERGRAGHAAALLPDGSVLVTGSGTLQREPSKSAEVFDRATRSWRAAASLNAGRDTASATVLADGRVLVVGGAERGGYQYGDGESGPSGIASAELYTPAPLVSGVSPSEGPSAGGTTVTVTGSNLQWTDEVRFGDVRAPSFEVVSPTRLTAVTPSAAGGRVQVVAISAGGSSLTAAPHPNGFRFIPGDTPGRVDDLQVRVAKDTEAELSWSATGSDGRLPPAAKRYIVKQAASPITDEASFAAAASLCGGECVFDGVVVGQQVVLTVSGLTPGTAHHWAVRAVGPNGRTGPISNAVSAKTTGTTPPPSGCPAVGAPAAGQVRYPAGWSLVGLPAGTRLPAASPLYGWVDQGAGGAYSTRDRQAGTEAGRGYWAWFPCPRLVDLAAAGPTPLELPLGAYRASMVGNPSDRPVTVSGYDYAARWDRALDRGAGGYRLSGHREVLTLAPGEGMWVFSYRNTTIRIAE